ncbi:MAG: hypothetical protein GSR80_000708 [Desulfurococcales archaeon]|nr:hypothetical protein [Desulfurococcales archaeon]
MAEVEAGEVKRRVVEVLRSAGRPLEVGEIAEALEWRGDLRPLRRVLAGLVREGVVLRVPDYERRRMVYMLAGGGGSGSQA